MRTVQVPGTTFTRRYSPRSSAVATYRRPLARSVAEIVAPGKTLFDSSVTTPLSEAAIPGLGVADRRQTH